MVIVYCLKDKKGNHTYEIDISSKGILLRCTKCNYHIVNTPKKDDNLGT